MRARCARHTSPSCRSKSRPPDSGARSRSYRCRIRPVSALISSGLMMTAGSFAVGIGDSGVESLGRSAGCTPRPPRPAVKHPCTIPCHRDGEDQHLASGRATGASSPQWHDPTHLWGIDTLASGCPAARLGNLTALVAASRRLDATSCIRVLAMTRKSLLPVVCRRRADCALSSICLLVALCRRGIEPRPSSMKFEPIKVT